ncbi:MAG: zf-HC2 domain-containing protein [candidate division Zixibacteria bacterium]|nr:zf-HC2 domain-containing protein [candidate division Zixibacteria bacterium]
MKCEDFNKFVYLYFDGELDAGKSKEMEEHLLTCQNCAAKLQELKKLEESAKSIRMPELSPDYWKTFAERVRNEIILRRRKSIWARLKSGWESFFFYSPVKLRIAAGIASVLLVFIVGKLYWDYKGKELERIRSERMEKVLIPQTQQKVEALAPAVKESLQVAEQKEETTFTGSKVSPVEEKIAQVPTPSESAISSIGGKGEEKAKQAGEGISSEHKKAITVTAERPVIEKGVTANLRTVTQAEMAMKPPSLPETILYVQKSPEDKRIRTTSGIPVSPRISIGDKSQPIEILRFYRLDNNWVHALTEKDTLVEADTLKKVISCWKEFFDKKPVPEWAPEGFSQIKIGYQLLFLKTRDQSALQEGIELLDKCKTSVTDQKIKEELSQKIAELETLKKK